MTGFGWPFSYHADLSADATRIVAIVNGNQEIAAKVLTTLTPTFSATVPKGGIQAPLSWPLVVQLAGSLGDSWQPGERLKAWIRAEYTRRVAERPAPRLDPTRRGSPPPRDYQWAGAELIARTGKAMVFDDPGTGKTLTAILGTMLRLRLDIGPVIVVCPNSVMDAWVDAWTRWTTLKAVAWRGSASRRAKFAGNASVYVVGYGTVRRDAAFKGQDLILNSLGASAVIVDECHLIKSRDSQQSRAVVRLTKTAHTVIAMSGTPISHHAGDLFPTLKALDPAAYTSYERFKDRYLFSVNEGYGGDTVLGLNQTVEPEFRNCILGQYRRVAKADVLDQLPPKVYSVRTVEIPAKYRGAYDDLERDMVAHMPDTDAELPAQTVLTQLQALLQLANCACDVEIDYTTEEDEYGQMVEKMHVHTIPKAPSWKADALLEVLAERPDRQTLVFAPSAGLIRVAEEIVSAAGYRTGLIIGGQSAAARTAVVDAFQAGELDVVLATTGAGGVGLTLTAASTVVFLQRPWSYIEAAQAEDRAHRIGSEIHESIEIVDIVAANTVDARVREVLTGKAGALADLLQDPRIRDQVLGGVK